MKHQNFSLLLIPIILLGFWSSGQAVNPPPDGGYPGGNTAEGTAALFSRTTGQYNAALGFLSLRNLTTASLNTGVGAGTLALNNGDENTASGAGALIDNTTGAQNTANGTFSLLFNTTGSNNTAVGDRALQNNTTGGFNIAIGFQAGLNVTTGSNNIHIGNAGVAGESNTIRIGVGNQTKTFITGIRGATTGIVDALPVFIDSAGQLGTIISSQRFKKEIQPMDNASEVILALKPVKFCYKNDSTNRPQFGLIAEQVAKINPELVVRDDKGGIYSVRYDAVNAMLLNEFLKEHQKVQEMEKALAGVTAQLKEQAAQIQKVSARLEVNKSLPELVVNNP